MKVPALDPAVLDIITVTETVATQMESSTLLLIWLIPLEDKDQDQFAFTQTGL